VYGVRLDELIRLYEFFQKHRIAWALFWKRLIGNADDQLEPDPFASLDVADDMEPRFPFEFQIEAVPLSLAASAKSREAWKDEIREVVDETVDPSGWATESPVSVTIFYFPGGPMNGDIDNIVKPILDALMPRIYLDDSQVKRVLVQKFESERSFQFENPTTKLAFAIDTEPPVVFIRIDNETSSDK
jgi:crossover junction endodeoxyribonuclease RusA